MEADPRHAELSIEQMIGKDIAARRGVKGATTPGTDAEEKKGIGRPGRGVGEPRGEGVQEHRSTLYILKCEGSVQTHGCPHDFWMDETKSVAKLILLYILDSSGNIVGNRSR